MKLYSVWQEVASMMYWTMLAACTVGPGTVVTCARAGAEYDLSLIWALVFASTLASSAARTAAAARFFSSILALSAAFAASRRAR